MDQTSTDKTLWEPLPYAVIFLSVTDGTWRVHLSPDLRDARAYKKYGEIYQNVHPRIFKLFKE